MEERILELERQIKEKDDEIIRLKCALVGAKQNIFNITNPSIKVLRLVNNLTLDAAAKELGITTATLYKLEKSEQPPSKAMLALMSVVYKFPMEQIFTPFEPKGE